MTLVGAVNGLLTIVTLAVLSGWFLAQRGSLDVDHRGVWRDLTRSLRQRSRVLPFVAFFGGWFGLWVVAVLVDAYLAGALLMFLAPVLLLFEYAGDGIGLTVGLIGLFLSGLKGSPEPDEEHFVLPIHVYESSAEDVSWIDDSIRVPRHSLLTLGASGAGKSETLKHFVEQLQTEPTEPVVVFDMKTDYQDFLAAHDVPMIRLSAEGSTTAVGSPLAWNIFRELDTEADADELARALFPSGMDDQFFATAGRQLFAANLKYLVRELDEPTNADLVHYWQRASP